MLFKILKVTGNSMHPTLESGAFILVKSPAWSPIKLKLLKHINWLTRLKPLSKLNFLSKITTAIKAGDIVAVNHPKYGQIIKRVNQVKYSHEHSDKSQQPMRLRLVGDNPSHSVSTEDMGWVDIDNVLGVVIFIVSA